MSGIGFSLWISALLRQQGQKRKRMQWKREQRLKELISCKYFGPREK
jgi:predicted nucleic acid-binding protein